MTSAKRQTVRAIHREMQALASPRQAAAAARYFKTAPGQYGEGDHFLGIRVPEVRRLAATHHELALRYVSTLLSSSWHEERLLALFIMVRQHARGAASHREAIHRLYMRRTKRVNNWDLVDSSAPQIVGAHLGKRARTELLRLARSPLLWERRIAVLATFDQIKRGEFADALGVAAVLLDDPHDLIHKAVGWMLREVGKRNRPAEEVFLRQHLKTMPRTMLRYAIERFPEKLRRRYLAA